MSVAPDQRLIFVSYSHKDNDPDNLVLRVQTHLKNLCAVIPGLGLWVDATNIRAGDTWASEIDNALAKATLAVLLVSPDFLNSTFIMGQELPRLWQRHDQTNLRLIPIQLRACTAPGRLSSLEMRPRGTETLADIFRQGLAPLDRSLKDITDEIFALLGPAAQRPPDRIVSGQGPPAGDVEQARCIALLTKTLFGNGSSEFYTALSAKLVTEIRRCANVSGDALFDAVRFFIEFQLLTNDEATSPAALEASLGMGGQSANERLVDPLRQLGRTGQFSGAEMSVASRFFGRTNAHADLWKTYFDAVVAAGASTQARVTSLVSIRATVGYLSPQFLIAGLLSRFEDDWAPVLNVYSRSTPHPGQRPGAFESLQASQWNCWLMWGPSIPVCQCPQWSGLCALQYGYGDENNSLPVVDLGATDGIGQMLGQVVSSLRAEGRAAKFGDLTFRLRWGPYFLLSQYSVSDQPDSEMEIVDTDAEIVDSDALVPTAKHGAAPAQASIYAQRGPAHRQTGDSLVLQFERLNRVLSQSRVYFSAYLWMMFLVATGPGTDVGPHLLSGKPCPGWFDDESERRKHVTDGRFWQDLLPAFVHANIGDPGALAFQKQVLVGNAIQLLRGVCSRQTELFHPDSVKAGVRFYLVCASDHTGCGHEPRFPAEDSLIELLRARLASEGDRAFAERVVVPGSARGHGLDGLESYFSACHLPELIGWYYDYVHDLNKSRPRP